MNDDDEYVFDDAARVRVAESLRIVEMLHEGKPTCRLCGQLVNQLDKFGLCSKVSVAHVEWREELTADLAGAPRRKARRRKAGAR